VSTKKNKRKRGWGGRARKLVGKRKKKKEREGLGVEGFLLGRVGGESTEELSQKKRGDYEVWKKG